jgi:hypothetical protein
MDADANLHGDPGAVLHAGNTESVPEPVTDSDTNSHPPIAYVDANRYRNRVAHIHTDRDDNPVTYGEPDAADRSRGDVLRAQQF